MCLGVTIDRNCTFSCHVNDFRKRAFHSSSTKGRIRKYLPGDALKRLANALVISRTDYCNSLLYGLPKSEIAKLQRVPNTAARLVTGASKYDLIIPFLRDLHWLPVEARIQEIDDSPCLEITSWLCTGLHYVACKCSLSCSESSFLKSLSPGTTRPRTVFFFFPKVNALLLRNAGTPFLRI